MYYKIKIRLIILFSIIICTFSCGDNDLETTFIVSTKVTVKKGRIPEVLALFKETNPGLVEKKKDWIGAIFSENEEENSVTVHAYWKDKNSYIEYSQSSEFQETIKTFSQYFIEKPEVEINKILFTM